MKFDQPHPDAVKRHSPIQEFNGVIVPRCASFLYPSCVFVASSCCSVDRLIRSNLQYNPK